MQIKAAIAKTIDDPFEIITCEIDDPGPGELLIRVKACGICHTDLAVKFQHIPIPLPRILGHEGAGIVERVGPGVTGLAEGDAVLMSYGSCGGCGNCSRGLPGYCDEFLPINFLGQRKGGSGLRYKGSEIGGAFFRQSAFATHAIATQRNVVKVAADLPLNMLAPLGCGIQTGAGTVLNTLAPSAGSSIAVFGTGAVGLAGVMAAKLAGCTNVVAVDVREDRLAVAREVGATHVINGTSSDVSAQIMAITGSGAHFSIDTTGNPAAVAASIDCLRHRGRSAQIAAPPRGTSYPLDPSVLMRRGLSICGAIEGDAIPQIFIPQLIEFFRRGVFPIDKLVTFFPFEDINHAIDEMETGAVVKPVLVME